MGCIFRSARTCGAWMEGWMDGWMDGWMEGVLRALLLASAPRKCVTSFALLLLRGNKHTVCVCVCVCAFFFFFLLQEVASMGDPATKEKKAWLKGFRIDAADILCPLSPPSTVPQGSAAVH